MEKENPLSPKNIESAIKDKGYYTIPIGTQIRVGIVEKKKKVAKPKREESIYPLILWRDIDVGYPISYINSSISLHLTSESLREAQEDLKTFAGDIDMAEKDCLEKLFYISETISKSPELVEKREEIEKGINTQKQLLNTQFLSESEISLDPEKDICDVNIYLHIDKENPN